MEQSTLKESSFATWVVIFLLLVIILAKGFFSFFVVGDKGQPTWDYRPVKDVPGESPYAIYEPLPHPQHVKGQRGE
jgi:flagellar basal body-associated protein FliL